MVGAVVVGAVVVGAVVVGAVVVGAAVPIAAATSRLLPPRSAGPAEAVVSTRLRSCVVPHVGFLDAIKAIAPATIGEEKLVPEADPHPAVLAVVEAVENNDTPGAARSTFDPYEENEALKPCWSTAPTERTFANEAGY